MNQIIFTHLAKKFKRVRYVFFVILPNLGTDTLKSLKEKKSTKLYYLLNTNLYKVGKHSMGKTTQKTMTVHDSHSMHCPIRAFARSENPGGEGWG